MSDNVPNMGRLSKAQRTALRALSSGATKRQAAVLAHRTERTLNRWIVEDLAFREGMKNATSVAIADASRRLAMMLDEAMDVLKDIMTKRGKPSERLRAVDMVISNLVKLREFHELEERIAALEEQVSNG